MSLLTQAMVFERFGPRLDTAALAEILGLEKKTVLNQVSAGTCRVPTYLDGGKRFADYRDVAAHFDAMRATAK